MTIDEYKKLQASRLRTNRHASMRDEEHRLQVRCVDWFRLTYPRLKHALFAIPNGGRRDAATGARLKDEGVLAGVADLALIKSNAHYGALFIEMKTARGKQSVAQHQWQEAITADGEYKYVICRSIPQFKREIQEYLADIR